MEIKSVELATEDGKTQKLAQQKTAQEIGHYLRTLALADPSVWNAYKALSAAGGQVYVVGGAVRDALMQKEPKDIDLMVSGVPAEQVAHTLDQLPGKVDLTGKAFGVYRYRTKGHEVEIALPRTEQSTGDRRSDFDVQVDHNLPIEKDLERRDFTVNAMAVNLDNGQLVDPHGGAEDIDSRRLQTVIPQSFEEDPTRLVRALVASSRHGLQPTEQTRAQMTANAPRLDAEARERIQAELDKLFKSDNPAGAIRLAQETGLLKHIFPEVHDNFDFDQRNPHHKHPLGQHLLHVLEGVSGQTKDPDLRLTALLHDIGKPSSQWIDPENGVGHYYRGRDGQGQDHDTVGADMAAERLRALKYPKARIDRVKHLIQHHMFPAFGSEKGARKFINRVGDDHVDDLMALRHADMFGKGTDEYQNTKTPVDTMREHVESVRAAGHPVSQSNLAINGNDVVELGVPRGPQIGQILRELTDMVVDNPALNTREELLRHVKGFIGATGTGF